MFVQTADTAITRPTKGFAAEPFCRDLCLISSHPELSGASYSYEHDMEIYGEGERVESFYKIVSGAVRTYKLLSDGRRQIDAFHFAGDLFGFEAADVLRINVSCSRADLAAFLASNPSSSAAHRPSFGRG